MFPYVSLGNISNTRKSVSSDIWTSRSGWSQNVFIHFRYLDRVAQLIMVIELSGVQFGLESYAWFEITSMISDQIALQEVNYHFYYIHFEIAQITDLLSSNILFMQCWAGLKLHSSFFFFLRGKQKFQNLPHDTLCLSFSCNLVGYFKQALKSDWLFFFLV